MNKPKMPAQAAAVEAFDSAEAKLTDSEAEQLIKLSAGSASEIQEYMQQEGENLSPSAKNFLEASLALKAVNEKSPDETVH